MIPALPGHDIQVRYVLGLDWILLDGQVVKVAGAYAVAVCYLMPPTIVVNWVGRGNVTGCRVFSDPEALVFLLASTAPVPFAVAA